MLELKRTSGGRTCYLELVHIIKEDFSVNTHYRPLFISFSCAFLIKCEPLAELISNSATFVSLRSSLRLTYWNANSCPSHYCLLTVIIQKTKNHIDGFTDCRQRSSPSHHERSMLFLRMALSAFPPQEELQFWVFFVFSLSFWGQTLHFWLLWPQNAAQCEKSRTPFCSMTFSLRLQICHTEICIVLMRWALWCNLS